MFFCIMLSNCGIPAKFRSWISFGQGPCLVCSYSKYRLNPAFGFWRKGMCWERQSHMDSLVIPSWLKKNQPWAWKTSLLRGNPHSLCWTDYFVRRSLLLFYTQCVLSVLFKCMCVSISIWSTSLLNLSSTGRS